MQDNGSIATIETFPRLYGGIPSALDSQHRLCPKCSNLHLLWVDDSQTLLSLYKSVYEGLGFEVLAMSSPRQALNHVSLATTDIVILDYEMPEMDGGQLAYLIKNRHPTLPIVLHSGCMDIPQRASRCVDALCAKAAPRAELLATIDRLSRRACKGAGHQPSFTPSSPH